MFYHNIEEPSKDTVKFVSQQNIVKNIPVTFEDAGLTEYIFGKYMSVLKGKKKRPHHPIVGK